MSKFDTKSSDAELSIPSAVDGSSGRSTMSGTGAITTATFPAGTGYSSAPPADEGTPMSSEDMEAIISEPTGPVPSAEEMEDRDDARRDAQRSADNLFPKEKLENGLKHARMILATGWAGFAASVRDLERTETVGKIKSGTVTMIDRGMDGLSKVGSRVAEVTDSGVKVVGAKMEEAAPTIGRWRDSVVNVSERSFTSAKEMTGKAISEIRSRPANASWGSSGGVWPANTSVPGSGPTAGGVGMGANDATENNDAGPHTV